MGSGRRRELLGVASWSEHMHDGAASANSTAVTLFDRVAPALIHSPCGFFDFSGQARVQLLVLDGASCRRLLRNILGARVIEGLYIVLILCYRLCKVTNLLQLVSNIVHTSTSPPILPLACTKARS
jgi:hypothetical protein